MGIKDQLSQLVGWMGYPGPATQIIDCGPFKSSIKRGSNVNIGRNTNLWGQIKLESNTNIPAHCMLSGDVTVRQGASLGLRNRVIGHVEIGRYAALAPNVSIQETNHVMDKPAIQSKLYRDILESSLGNETKGPIVIGPDVWIGTNSTILSGVNIGAGAIVGAGAVVTRDVEPYSIVVGGPAEHVKYRFDRKTREALLDIKWWNWEKEQIQAERDFFETTIVDADSVYDLVSTSESEKMELETEHNGTQTLGRTT